MLAAVMDFARRAGKSKVSLRSLPSAISFYLGANPPFTFNNPNNLGTYGKMESERVNNRTAKRTAANVFQNRKSGMGHLVPMTAKLRKSRRKNRKNRTRQRG